MYSRIKDAWKRANRKQHSSELQTMCTYLCIKPPQQLCWSVGCEEMPEARELYKEGGMFSSQFSKSEQCPAGSLDLVGGVPVWCGTAHNRRQRPCVLLLLFLLQFLLLVLLLLFSSDLPSPSRKLAGFKHEIHHDNLVLSPSGSPIPEHLNSHLFFLFPTVFRTVFLYFIRWPLINDPPVSQSWVLGLRLCAVMPVFQVSSSSVVYAVHTSVCKWGPGGGSLLYHCLYYSFETWFLTETAGRLADSELQWHLCLHPL